MRLKLTLFIFLAHLQFSLSQYAFAYKSVNELMSHLEQGEEELLYACSIGFGRPVDSLLGMDNNWYEENSHILNDCRAKLVCVNDYQFEMNEFSSSRKVFIKDFPGKRILQPPRFLFFLSKNARGTQLAVQMFY